MRLISVLFAVTFALSCSNEVKSQKEDMQQKNNVAEKLDTAVFAGGCFWCIEAIFQDFKGVVNVESGYSNGIVKKPTYKEVCTGKTGCAEVALITFNADIISYKQLLEIFWHAHNPTTLNRQGADIGTQYRSGIYYLNEDQKEQALESKAATQLAGLWKDTIVTEILPLADYSKAEEYHQNYFNNNPQQGYCSVVIAPKVAKIRKEFGHLLK